MLLLCSAQKIAEYSVVARNEVTKQSHSSISRMGLPRSLRSLAMTIPLIKGEQKGDYYEPSVRLEVSAKFKFKETKTSRKKKTHSTREGD